GAASYFFHPREMSAARQNRAIAISYYAGAPFAWLWVPATMFAIGWGILSLSKRQEDLSQRFGVDVFLGAIIVALAIAGVFWLRTIFFLKSCTTSGEKKQIAFAIY